MGRENIASTLFVVLIPALLFEQTTQIGASSARGSAYSNTSSSDNDGLLRNTNRNNRQNISINSWSSSSSMSLRRRRREQQDKGILNLILPEEDGIYYEAEQYNDSSRNIIIVDSDDDDMHHYYTGTGYIELPSKNSFFEARNINGGITDGTAHTVAIKYISKASSTYQTRPCSIIVNDEIISILAFPVNANNEDSVWEWEYIPEISLNPGRFNTIRINALTNQGGPSIDNIFISSASFVGSSTALLPTAAPHPATSEPSSPATAKDTIISCPQAGTNITLAYPGIYQVQVSFSLCTLTLVTTNINSDEMTITAIKPLARSYSNNDWEISPGKYAGANFIDNILACDNDIEDGGFCTILISPPIVDAEGESNIDGNNHSNNMYVLTSYPSIELDTYTSNDIWARFLEQTTFGTTKELLNEVTNGNFKNEAEWLQHQIYNVNITSHRAYFRTRVNPKRTSSTLIGKTDHPCKKKSRWRKYSFTYKDKFVSTTTNDVEASLPPRRGIIYIKGTSNELVMFKDPLTEEAIPKYVPTPPYILLDGNKRARTVVNDFIWENEEIQNLFPYWNTTHGYYICDQPDEWTVTPDIPKNTFIRRSSLKLLTRPYEGSGGSSSCEPIAYAIGNPIVNFPAGYESEAGKFVFYLNEPDSVDNDDLLPIDKWMHYETYSKLEAEFSNYSLDGVVNRFGRLNNLGTGYLKFDFTTGNNMYVEFNLEITRAGMYDIFFRYQSRSTHNKFLNVSIDDEIVMERMPFQPTGISETYWEYTNMPITSFLSVGEHKVKISSDGILGDAGPSEQTLNIDSIEVRNTEICENLIVIEDITTQAERYVLPNGITSETYQELCEQIPKQKSDYDDNVFAYHPSVGWLIWDAQLELQSNTIESPIPDGGYSEIEATAGGTLCQNAPRTFLNFDHCMLTKGEQSACQVTAKEDILFELNSTNIVQVNELTGRYIYAIQGLSVTQPDYAFELEHACTSGLRSRWLKIGAGETCSNPTPLQRDTYESLSDLISDSDDKNPFIRDIIYPKRAECADNDVINGPKEIQIQVGSDCWTRVHPEHLSVWDLTYWTLDNTHFGNKYALTQNRPNPIKKWAEAGGHELWFPIDHPISRWEESRERFTFVGRLGDTIGLSDLPNELLLDQVAAYFGTHVNSVNNKVNGTNFICGSPYEVENDPSTGEIFDMDPGPFDSLDTIPLSVLRRQKEVVWLNVVLNAQDQLRQRMAWALVQILPIQKNMINLEARSTELFSNYYDILVRNAFGNYLDLLREISYSAVMAESLTYLKSKSTAHVWETLRRIEFADENFAREIMQLFTIGLIELNQDGTPKLDDNGKTIPTYSTGDIQSFARAWTGFNVQEGRGNIEEVRQNRIDPMEIVPAWRDRFPKTDLYGGYIGDGYPLCTDLPDKQFLRKGAQYRLLGWNPHPQMVTDTPVSDIGNGSFSKRMVLNNGDSELFSLLCGDEEVSGTCRFPHRVELDSNLACNGVECVVDIVRVVQVENMFYEYVQPPCVEHAFYENGMKINTAKNTPNFDISMCANPLLPVATSSCCREPHPLNGIIEVVMDNVYDVERMTFATQDERCRNLSLRSCDYDLDAMDGTRFTKDIYRWATSPCTVKAKVSPDGNVAIVHDTRYNYNCVEHVSENSRNYFGVDWANDTFPQERVFGCSGVCEVTAGGDCLCDTIVEETTVFISLPDSVDVILSSLHIGAPHPSSFDDDMYTSNDENGFTVHFRNPDGIYDEDTIFEVRDSFRHLRFVKNIESRVYVRDGAGTRTDWSFRNPVHFMSLIPSETNRRDATYETEATLRHYLHHSNTPPFLCTRLIKRFGISNPSPRYVKTCADAFHAGQYKHFGTGDYGDLAATLAAILLDREARSIVLDSDPSFGAMREPLLKVISFMRSMEFKLKEPNSRGILPFVILNQMDEILGQMVFSEPTVFSFYLPDYAPKGRILEGTLTSPETELADGAKVVRLLNGIHSMIKFGLSDCPVGGNAFGIPDTTFSFIRPPHTGYGCVLGDYSKAIGYLRYKPTCGATATEVVNELATLLTSGRLTAVNREAIVAAYENAVTINGDADSALRVVQELITTTSEFNTNGRPTFTDAPRVIAPPPLSTGRSYQAIVYLYLQGGLDSFQVLVPKDCSPRSNGMNAYEHYRQTRQPLHELKETLLPIDSNGHANCEQFGIHKDLPILQELYNDRDLVFFANAGVLAKPTNRENYVADTPTNLFSHNTMQEETMTVDIFGDFVGTGVLGRLNDILTSKNISCNALCIQNQVIAAAGRTTTEKTLGRTGAFEFWPEDEIGMNKTEILEAIGSMHKATFPGSNFMAETWSSNLLNNLADNEKLNDIFKNVDTQPLPPDSDIGKSLSTAAKLIRAHEERQIDVDIITVYINGFDSHARLNDFLSGLTGVFPKVNDAIATFVEEMKQHNIWDSVTVVQASEFGRTLTPNSNEGTDHGWGGNYFMFGGSVNGGQILGQYPEDMSETSDINTGRGSLIPTTSWEQIWTGVLQHHGVDAEDELDFILPNRGNFQNYFSSEVLFDRFGSESPNT